MRSVFIWHAGERGHGSFLLLMREARMTERTDSEREDRMGKGEKGETKKIQK